MESAVKVRFEILVFFLLLGRTARHGHGHGKRSCTSFRVRTCVKRQSGFFKDYDLRLVIGGQSFGFEKWHLKRRLTVTISSMTRRCQDLEIKNLNHDSDRL